MAYSVPANQSVSRTVYGCAVREAARLPETFIAENIARIDRAFQYGETVEQIVAELKMLYSIRPIHRPMKSPRALAKRVMRIHDTTIQMLKDA